MGAQKKYSPRTLEKAVKRYFASITRKTKLMEKKATGQRDDKGHMIYTDVPVVNTLGDEVEYTEYLFPPSVGDLSAFLGIHRSTWNAWCDGEKHPEYQEITQWASGLMHAYLERESLTRSGKDLKGILFNLENNYGYKEQQRVVLSGGGIEEYLQTLAENEQSQGAEF